MIKALMIESESVSRFHEIERKVLGPNDVRVSIRHVGLCGSDLNTFKGLNPLVTLPRIPGHEIGGEVVEFGPAVSAGLPVGTRVIVMPYTSCGECSACRKGRVNACRYNKTLGVQQDGGLAEEIVLPESKLIRNDSLPAHRLALVEPLSVGFHAVKRGRVARTDRVVVIGCGMIGMGAVIAAVREGADVVAVEPSAEKRAMAEAFGARRTIDPMNEDVTAVIEAWSRGDGADVVLEAVGLPQTFTQSIDLASYGGRVVYVGYSKAPVTYDSKYFNLKELDILGSRNATLADFESVIGHLELLGDKTDILISKVFPFDEAERALPFWSTHTGALKVIVERSA
jgi:2-desacetyl-2-hydroxyethyl bacteriochlorophyllide A dehydrogenase